MADDREWIEQKIQRQTGGYYRVSVPPEYGDKYRKDDRNEKGIERTTVRDYVIIRSVDSGVDTSEVLSFSPELEEKFEERSEKYVKSFVRKAIQSYYVAGMDDVKVELPSEWDDGFRSLFETTFLDIQFETDSVNYNPDELVFTIDDGIDFEEYITTVRQFLNRTLIRILRSNDTDTVFDDSSITDLSNMETNMDARWALTTRETFQQFFNLEVPNYPQGICELYIGKYLERMVDLVEQLIEELRSFEDRFGEHAEIVLAVRDLLADLFVDGAYSDKSFDTQVKDVTEASYNHEVSIAQFITQVQIYQEQTQTLRWMNRELGDGLSSVDRDVGAEELVALGMALGRIVRIAHQLLRFPRSITLVGLLTNNIQEIHALEE